LQIVILCSKAGENAVFSPSIATLHGGLQDLTLVCLIATSAKPPQRSRRPAQRVFTQILSFSCMLPAKKKLWIAPPLFQTAPGLG
jgi:hypothetical protein